MFCPQCGQQQSPGEIRFCSRCGLPLGNVTDLVANGGVMPVYAPPGEEGPSPRRKGVQQGVTLIMLGIITTIVFGILNGYLGTPEFFTAMAAVIGFVGGPLRVLYALIFEEGAKRPLPGQQFYGPPMSPTAFGPPPRQAALPPRQGAPVSNWTGRHHTAEMVSPGSVTENTTRLLERDPENTER